MCDQGYFWHRNYHHWHSFNLVKDQSKTCNLLQFSIIARLNWCCVLFLINREHFKEVFPFHMWLKIPFGDLLFPTKPQSCLCSCLFSTWVTWWPSGGRHVDDVLWRRSKVLQKWNPDHSKPHSGKRHTRDQNRRAQTAALDPGTT